MSIRDVLGARERAGDDAGEDGGPLFAPGKCHSRQSNKPIPALHVKDDADELFLGMYLQLASAGGSADAAGGWFKLTFLSDKKWVVTVRGRELLPLYAYASEGRISWLQPLDAGPVRSVTVEAVEE